MEDTRVPSWSNLSSFKTPLRVLVQQFLASRERWKAKCKVIQEKAKTYRIELRDLRRSRDHWKNKAKELAKEMAKDRNRLRSIQESIIFDKAVDFLVAKARVNVVSK